MGERQQAGKNSGDGGRRDHQDEARRILDRLEREETSATGFVRRGVARSASHLSASDADADDKIELWATRIGRLLGLIITVAIIIWLISYLLGA